jgi:uncharacterized membrane protein
LSAAVEESVVIQDPVGVLAVLLAILAGLFSLAQTPWGERFFRMVPLLVFAYFLPATLSNTGLLPLASPTYDFIKTWLLPASLLLLTMSVDIPAILHLGRSVIILFLAGTASVVVGGPLAYLAFGWLVSGELGDQSWKGLAALSGSWIGGGANFVAIGESVGATSSTLGMMVVVDVALANIWMAILLIFSGHDKRMDAALGADRTKLDRLRARVEAFQQEVKRPSTLADLLTMLFLAIGGTVAAAWAAARLPELGGVLTKFAWTVILVTALGVVISFTRLRKLEGAGASQIGSLFLYLLVASIGATAEFAKVFEEPGLFVVAAVWISIHALILMAVRHMLKAPVFYMAVGSQANIGGAASAPIVANAFHPALAPVGALMGVAGYVLGTYAGLLCALLLRIVHGIYA